MADGGSGIATVDVWGVPLASVTMAGAVAEIERRVDQREPGYLVSANLNYAMLCERDERLAKVNREAAMVLVDGMPLVWASRLGKQPLPERVAGSDLIFSVCDLAAERGFRVVFLGGAPGVAEAAAAKLVAKYPALTVAGIECPPFGPMSPDDEQAMLARIRAADAQIVVAAFSQPRGEVWIAEHHRATGAAVCVQIGASLDFAAGRVRRAPRWVRRSGLEWMFRLAMEPRRLAGRYARNASFLARMVVARRSRPVRVEVAS